MTDFLVLDVPIDSSGTGRGEERAPRALRAAGLVERLGARDAGETDARISDSKRDLTARVVGASQVRRAATTISERVRELLATDRRPLLVGGDCTLLLGVFEALPSDTGLWFIDGHADFLDGTSSPTGEAADMDLAILTGNGPPGLLDSDAPLVEPAAVVLLGHRPGELDPEVASENARLDPDIDATTAPKVREHGAARVGRDAAMQLAGRPAWLHLDLDVLDQHVLPAVSYPQPLGLDWRELAELAQPLVSAPNLIGVSVADFNPDGDPDGSHAARTVAELAGLFSDHPKR